MRVISGLLRSRRIDSPKGRDVRPTSDRVRESLFSVIERDVQDACVLDLFAGSGALGIEAISRGASFVTFVELSPRVAGVLRENLRALEIEEKASVTVGDAMETVRDLSRRRARFGVVFMDPPYSRGLSAAASSAVAEGGILAEDGVMVVEHAKKDILEAPPGGFWLARFLEFGDTVVSIYRRNGCGK